MFDRKTTFSPRIDFNSNILDQQGVSRSSPRWFLVPGPDDGILVCFLIKNPPGSRRKYRHLAWQLVSRRDARSLLVIAMQNARSILPSRGRTEGTASINKYLARKWLRTDRRTLSRRERGWFLIGEGKKQTPDWMIVFFLPSFFLSDAQANLFSKFCLYSLVPLFFSFIMKKQILLGSWKQLREILDISLGHCRFTFVGTDYTERIFFTGFIQVLLNFFLEIWDIFTIKCTIV